MGSETENPLARRLRDQQDDKDLATGRAGLEKDFIVVGKAQAPEHLEEVRGLIQQYMSHISLSDLREHRA
jgi:hypothetical protein